MKRLPDMKWISESVWMLVLVIAMLAAGCISYKCTAPMVVLQRGPETNYNQERSAVTSRSTAAEQQVADTTAPQTQTDNTVSADMPTAMETTKQVGLKQGQAATTTKTQGDTSPATTTSEGQAPVGHQGSDTTAIGQTAPTATSESAPPPAAE